MTKVRESYQRMYKNPSCTILELTQLLGLLSSTIQAVFPARLQFRFLQRQQILALKQTKSFVSKVTLQGETLKELEWWIENLALYKGKRLVQPQSQTILQTDASLKGWGIV